MARNESISENAVWTAMIGACFVPVSGHQPRNSEFCSIVAATRGYNRLKDSDWNRCSQRGGSVLIIREAQMKDLRDATRVGFPAAALGLRPKHGAGVQRSRDRRVT
jgi:hypothetical protein